MSGYAYELSDMAEKPSRKKHERNNLGWLPESKPTEPIDTAISKLTHRNPNFLQAPGGAPGQVAQVRSHRVFNYYRITQGRSFIRRKISSKCYTKNNPNRSSSRRSPPLSSKNPIPILMLRYGLG